MQNNHINAARIFANMLAETKSFRLASNKMRKFTKAPREVQERILEALKQVRYVYVVRNGDRYSVTTHLTTQRSERGEWEYLGKFTMEEIYSPDERILNFVEVMHDYPPEYRGKRDYLMLQSVSGNNAARFRWLDGNIVLERW